VNGRHAERRREIDDDRPAARREFGCGIDAPGTEESWRPDGR